MAFTRATSGPLRVSSAATGRTVPGVEEKQASTYTSQVSYSRTNATPTQGGQSTPWTSTYINNPNMPGLLENNVQNVPQVLDAGPIRVSSAATERTVPGTEEKQASTYTSQVSYSRANATPTPTFRKRTTTSRATTTSRTPPQSLNRTLSSVRVTSPSSNDVPTGDRVVDPIETQGTGYIPDSGNRGIISPPVGLGPEFTAAWMERAKQLGFTPAPAGTHSAIEATPIPTNQGGQSTPWTPTHINNPNMPGLLQNNVQNVPQVLDSLVAGGAQNPIPPGAQAAVPPAAQTGGVNPGGGSIVDPGMGAQGGAINPQAGTATGPPLGPFVPAQVAHMEGATRPEGTISAGYTEPGTYRYIAPTETSMAPSMQLMANELQGNYDAQLRAGDDSQAQSWAWQDYYRTLVGGSLGLGKFGGVKLDPLAQLQDQLQAQYDPSFIDDLMGIPPVNAGTEWGGTAPGRLEGGAYDYSNPDVINYAPIQSDLTTPPGTRLPIIDTPTPTETIGNTTRIGADSRGAMQRGETILPGGVFDPNAEQVYDDSSIYDAQLYPQFNTQGQARTQYVNGQVQYLPQYEQGMWTGQHDPGYEHHLAAWQRNLQDRYGITIPQLSNSGLSGRQSRLLGGDPRETAGNSLNLTNNASGPQPVEGGLMLNGRFVPWGGMTTGGGTTDPPSTQDMVNQGIVTPEDQATYLDAWQNRVDVLGTNPDSGLGRIERPYDSANPAYGNERMAPSDAVYPQDRWWLQPGAYTPGQRNLGMGNIPFQPHRGGPQEQQIPHQFSPGNPFQAMIGRRNEAIGLDLTQRAAGMGVQGAYEGLMGEQNRIRSTLASKAEALYRPAAYEVGQQYRGASDQLLNAINQAELQSERIFATSGV